MVNPLVSIIIPVYNVEEYINESLESIVQQTYENIEIIIVDDGSTDDSISNINTYMQLKNVTLINQENKGASAARNTGLKNAKGKYVYFFDGDDLLESGAINTFVTEMENNNLDLLLFSGKSFYDIDFKDNIALPQYTKEKSSSGTITGVKALEILVSSNEYTPSPCLYFIRRDFLLNKHLKFYEGIRYEDELYTLKLLLVSKKTKIIPEIFFHRRVRGNSVTTSTNYVRKFSDLYVVIIEALSFIQNRTTSYDLKVKRAINKKLGQIYSSLINSYIYLDKEDTDTEIICIKINKIKKIGKKYNYFNRVDIFLFNKNIKLYKAIRKNFNKMKYFKRS